MIFPPMDASTHLPQLPNLLPPAPVGLTADGNPIHPNQPHHDALPLSNGAAAAAGPGSSHPPSHRCPIEGCQRSFPRRYNLESHLLCHSGEKPYACEMSGCSAAFARRHDLRRHTRTMHDKTRPYGCATCSHRFVKIDLLNRHLLAEGHIRGF
ncbi:hypothetical protein HK101_000517 [Irineochytrium annulatum]|nr:hypothetical protein HK101_000517 [Irineochytrium annulatum]